MMIPTSDRQRIAPITVRMIATIDASVFGTFVGMNCPAARSTAMGLKVHVLPHSIFQSHENVSITS